MEQMYLVIMDFTVGCINIIRFTEQEMQEQEKYDDIEDYLKTKKDEWGLYSDSCTWMVTDSVEIHRYYDGKDDVVENKC